MKRCRLFFLFMACAMVRAEEAFFYRILSSDSNVVVSLSADGYLSWTNAIPGEMRQIQRAKSLSAPDWQDFVKVAPTTTVARARVSHPNTPPEFFFIPAGWFTMGRTSGDTDSNAPPVNVHVSGFFMGRHEVTWTLWNEVRDWAMNHGYNDIRPGNGKCATCPVVWVNWFDVLKWCNARSEMEGLSPVYLNLDGSVYRTRSSLRTVNWDANGYRLPTEAEWEKSARGGKSGLRFPWGDTITHSHANYYSSSSHDYDISPTRGYHPDFDDGTTPLTSPVGSFAANGYGLYDMAGNVREWCWDVYSPTGYTEGAMDPRSPVLGLDRVLRGGAWGISTSLSRCSYRNVFPLDIATLLGGFRLSRNSDP